MVNLIQMIVAQAATTAFEVIMQKKTLDLIESSEKEWNENFRYFVSGYYEGIAIRYLWPVLCIFLVLCTIGSYISGSENWGYSLFSWRVPSQCLYIRLYFKKICGLFFTGRVDCYLWIVVGIWSAKSHLMHYHR